MFERIKAYRNLRKSDKFLKGCKRLAILTSDTEMLSNANASLYYNEIIRRKMLFNRKIAVNYNLGLIKNGLN